MRLVMKAYKYKLYNNKKNKYLVQQIEIASEIWNFCIAMRRMYYLVYGKNLSGNTLKKYIAKICKRRKWAHWHNLGSQAIQDVVERVDRAYKAYFIKPISTIRKRHILLRSRCRNSRSVRCTKASHSNRQAISLTVKVALLSTGRSIVISILVR